MYPNLRAEIARRGLSSKTIAESLGINPKTFGNKLSGKTAFSWPEACAMANTFFPDIDKDVLFSEGSGTQQQPAPQN